jgi:LDH2 family malate/lactate/ureidoglycolate dehydrogenase
LPDCQAIYFLIKIYAPAQIFTFSAPYLSDFTTQVFIHFGVPEKDAVQASAVLSKADLRGIDSHGVARLRTYVDMFKIGRINPKPNIKIIREKKSVATVDGIAD